MLSSQLFWRVLAVYAALIVGTALAFGGILSARYRGVVQEQMAQRLRERAAMLQAIAESSTDDAVGLHTLFARMATLSRRDFVFSETGAVLWDSHREGQSDAPEDDPELLDRLKTAAETGRAKAVFGEDVRYSLAELASGPHRGGYVVTMQPAREFDRDLSARDTRLWGAALAIGIVALAVTYFVVGRIIRPLETLTRAAQQIAAGDTPPEIAISSRNEIGALAEAFNSMSQQLAARIYDLEEHRGHLEHGHARLETVLGAMLEGVIAVDAEERILFANNAAIHLFDLSPASMLGRPIWEVVRHPQLQELVHQALSGEQPPRLEFDVARTQSTAAATVSPLPGRPVMGAVMVLHDVTELRRLESMRREFVQNVSHELKTPLSSIAAYADTLLDGGLDDPTCNRQFVAHIAEQADRLHALILDLLALGRMDVEQGAFDVAAIDVTKVITASIEAHRAVASAKRVTLSRVGPSTPVFGIADEEGLRTIVDNLLDNAINYTPADGRVTIRWHNSGDGVVIDVEDNGVGIAREHQARIFERFYRIDKARSRELGGTGLGLSIVKHLCQVFGGSVQVRSQLGQGSTFTVRLKAAEQLAVA